MELKIVVIVRQTPDTEAKIQANASGNGIETSDIKWILNPFDEFAVAWFVSGLNKTVPVIILEILQGNTDPRINAIGSVVFVTSITLIILAQIIYMRKSTRKSLTGF